MLLFTRFVYSIMIPQYLRYKLHMRLYLAAQELSSFRFRHLRKPKFLFYKESINLLYQCEYKLISLQLCERVTIKVIVTSEILNAKIVLLIWYAT